MFKILSEKIALEISSQFKSAEVQQIISLTKAAGDDRRFKVIASTGSVDRHGDVVVPEGMVSDNFMKNPVVLFGHDYRSLPIGLVDKLYVKEGKVIAEGKFAPEDANPEAEKVKKLYDGGFLRAVSIGFMPLKWESYEDDDGYHRKYTKWELLELSFVPVPANSEALDIMKEMAKKLGVDPEKMFVTRAYKDNETTKMVKDLALVVKGVLERVKQLENNKSQEPEPKAKEGADGDKNIVISADTANQIRKGLQAADKVLEQVNVSFKEALKN